MPYSPENTWFGILFNKLYWKETQDRCFPVNVAKCSFLYRTHPVHYTFQQFYVMTEFLGCLRVQNWYFSYFLFHCFVFQNSSVRIGSPLLFRIYLVFIPKFSLSVTWHGLQQRFLHYFHWIAKLKKQLQNYSKLSR